MNLKSFKIAVYIIVALLVGYQAGKDERHVATVPEVPFVKQPKPPFPNVSSDLSVSLKCMTCLNTGGKNETR